MWVPATGGSGWPTLTSSRVVPLVKSAVSCFPAPPPFFWLRPQQFAAAVCRHVVPEPRSFLGHLTADAAPEVSGAQIQM